MQCSDVFVHSECEINKKNRTI